MLETVFDKLEQAVEEEFGLEMNVVQMLLADWEIYKRLELMLIEDAEE